MSKRCEMYTKFGKRCKKPATYFHTFTKTNNCSTHSQICKKAIINYKTICRKVKTKCTSDMTKSELISIIDLADQCKTHRIRFQKICCKNDPDIGHKNAIIYIDKLGSQCYNLYKKKYIK